MWSRIATISRRSGVICKPQISRPKACLLHLSLSAHGKKGSGEEASKYSSTLNLPATTFPMRADAAVREPQLLKDVYKWQYNNNPGPLYVSHDGPPYANGKPHVGHALNKILKDIVNRYKMMKGYKVSYIPGWDCHGLPIELKAMEALKGKAKGMNPIEIRDIATKYALEQIEVQKKEFKRWGVLGDWDNGYKTMEPKYEARQIGVFARMVKRGLIYRGLRPVYWSPSSRTALADAELEWMDNHVSPSIYVAFPVKSLPEKLKHWEKYSNLHATIWTTTPWTIPANMAISVNDAFEYSVVKHGDKHLLVARKRIEDLEKEFKSSLTPIDTVSGSNLVGMVCSHPIFGRDSPVLAGSHVTLESGTGLVHTAPGHGREDWLVCRPFNIPVLCPVNDDGVFTKEAGPQFEGKDIFKDGNRIVIEELQNRNVLLKKEDYTHRYPYDWRTKKPVIWRATKQWFTDLTHIKDTAIEEVNNVQLVPPSGRARLSAMLKTRDDWCISRQRHWGVPIPVFYDVETDEHLMNDETIEFIQELIRKHGTNCWWTMSTEELLPPKYRNNGRKYRKGTDTMDVWFDSGCSWASVLTDVYKKGESLKDEEAVLNDIVADIYLEGSDQHRGWFQSSLLTSVAVRDKAPFKTIVTHGFTLDEHGRKMSKSLGNVIEPSQVIEGGNDKKKNPAYGVDVLRFWVSSTDYSNDVTISESLLEATSSNLKKLRNTCRFLLGNLNDFSAKDQLPYDQLSSVDKYMLHRLTQFAKSIDESYESFNFSQVYKELTQFGTGDLSSFYFEISKDKLYTMSKKSQHRKSCQTVLLKILDTLSKAMAPILCHTAEDIFQHSPILQQIKKQGTESIHAQGWFDLAPEWNNPELEAQWLALKELKSNVNKILEHARQNEEKSHIHTALDASVKIKLKAGSPMHKAINSVGEHLNEVFVVSGTTVEVTDTLKAQGEFSIVVEDDFGNYVITVEKSANHKCPRCWKRTSTEEEKLCSPCDTTVKEL